MSTTHLEITGLNKAYGKNQVLHDLHLRVHRGKCLVIFGGSGGGKTTLLRHIAGIMQADSGSVRIDGRDVLELDAQTRGVAMAFQNFALYPHMSAYENIASPLRARGFASDIIANQVQEVATLLRINHVLSHLPRQLSNGQKQRTALARALVHKPPVLLLDDPLRNVDAKIRFEMRQEFPRLFKAFGSTVLYVTQDWREALALGDQVGVLEGGRFAQLDTPQCIYRNPQTRSIARLFGDPPINLFDVTPYAAENMTQVMAVNIGGHRLHLPQMRADLLGRDCVLGVRAEDLLFTPGTHEEGKGTLPVQLQARMPFNMRIVEFLRTGQGEQGSVEILASRAETGSVEHTPQQAPRVPMPGHLRIINPLGCLFFDRNSGQRM